MWRPAKNMKKFRTFKFLIKINFGYLLISLFKSIQMQITLFEPYCREMIVWPARIWSSLNCLTFLSASFGPIVGLPYCPTFRPSDWMQITTAFKFCRSHKSTLWNVSWFGTWNILMHASTKPVIFSMHLNAILLSLIRFTEPGLIAFTNLQRITPSLSTSKKLSISPLVLIGSPVISFTHSKHSAANSSLYFELIYK